MKKQNFLKGSAILMLSAVAAKLLGALFKIPLTNMLGGLGMSCFSSAYTIFMPVYALTTAGISSAAARMTAQSAAFGLRGNTLRIRRVSLAVFSAAGILGSLLVMLLAFPFSLWSSGSYEAAPAIMMIAPAVLFGCVTSAERGYYEGLSNMYPTALSQAAEGIVKVAAGLSLCLYVTAHGRELMEYFPWLDDVRPLAAAAGILGVTLSSLGAVVFFAVLRLLHRENPRPSGTEPPVSRREIASELVRTSLPAGLSAVVTNLTAVIDMWTMIALIAAPSAAHLPAGVTASEYPRFVYGSFAGIALTIFNLVPSVTNMLGKGVLPMITEAWSARDSGALRSGTRQALLTAAALSVPCAFGLGILSPQVLELLFPERRAEAELCISAIRLLMPGMVFLCLSFPLFSMLQAIGRPGAPLKIMLLGTAVKLAGNLLLVPPMGAEGAAAATSVCYAVILAVSLRQYLRCSGVQLSAAPFGAVVYSGLMCAGAAYLTADITRRSGAGVLWQIMLTAAAGGSFYLLALWLSAGRRLVNRAVKRA